MHARTLTISIVLTAGLLSLAGCQSSPSSTVAGGEPSPRSTVTGGETVPRLLDHSPDKSIQYIVSADLSDIRLLVYRAGALARLGHNHVVQARNIKGEIYLAPEIHNSRFSIEIPVKDLVVDSAGPRLDEGEEFSRQPDADAIAGTTRNMLGEKVLDAANYQTIKIDLLALNGPIWGLDATVRIKLHGVERDLVVPAMVENGNDKLVVSSVFSVSQKDFGIAAFSVLGGALQVADTVKIRMRIVAIKG